MSEQCARRGTDTKYYDNAALSGVMDAKRAQPGCTARRQAPCPSNSVKSSRTITYGSLTTRGWNRREQTSAQSCNRFEWTKTKNTWNSTDIHSKSLRTSKMPKHMNSQSSKHLFRLMRHDPRELATSKHDIFWSALKSTITVQFCVTGTAKKKFRASNNPLGTLY